MIQQTGNNNTNNIIKQRLQELCMQENSQSSGVPDLVRNLFEIQSIQTQNSNLYLLAQAVIQVANLPQLTTKTQKVIIDVITSMIVEIKQFQYKIGIYYVGYLLISPRIQEIITQKLLLQTNSDNNSYITKQRRIIKDFLSHQKDEVISQKLADSNIKSQPILTTLGILKLLLSTIYYFSQKEQNQKKEDNKKILKQIQDSCRILLNQRYKNIRKQQLQIIVQISLKLQNIYQIFYNQNTLIGYQLAWDSITLVFSIENLEKKLHALSVLDTLIEQINEKKNKNIKLVQKILKFLKLILQPRNHQQILNRSINFLLFWLQNAEQRKNLQEGLRDWFIHLILKSDIRTSNIFGNTWQKLVTNIRNIDDLQVTTMYDVSASILNQFINEKNSTGVTTRSKARKQNKQQTKVIKIMAPLINKQFHPLSLHSGKTLEYLILMWSSLQNLSQIIKDQIILCLKNSIIGGISTQFNLYVLNQNIIMLKKYVQQYQIKQNQHNLFQVQQKILFIYDFVASYLSWLSQISKKNNSLQYQQIRQKSQQMLTNQQFLNNLIISHSPNNRKQLQQLLFLVNMIIQYVNNIDFEKVFLPKTMNKIDNSDEFFLLWFKNRLNFIENMEFKTYLTLRLFNNQNLYSSISIQGLKQLLQILSLSNYTQQQKKSICFMIVKQIDEQIRQSALNLILNTMWSPLEISQQNFLTQTGRIITKMGFNDQQQLDVYLQIIRICSLHNPITNEKLFSQNIAMQEDVEIKILISEEHIQKVIKCSDSISLIKIIKNEIQPLITSQLFSHLGIQSIFLDNIQISQNSYLLTLRKLGFVSDKINVINVRLRDKTYLLIKNMNYGMLKHILNNFYKVFETTKNIFHILNAKQLKNLQKYLQNQVLNNKNIKLQQILKQNFLSILNKIIKKLLGNRHENNRLLISQLVDFLTQIDENDLLKQEQSRSSGYSHCFFMSKTQYIFKKAIKILESYKIDENIFYNKKQSKKKNSKSQKNLKLRSQKIAYQFINTLIVGQQLYNHVCMNLDLYIYQKDISQNYYMVAFGLECLWIALKNSEIIVLFFQYQKLNDIFSMISRYTQQVYNIDKKKLEEQQLQMHSKILITAFKIVNKIVRVVLMKMQNIQITLITRNLKDLLNLEQIKKNIQRLSSPQSLKQLISQDKDTLEMTNIVKLCQTSPKFNIPTEQITPLVARISDLMIQYNNHASKRNLLLLFYEISRLICWVVILAPQQEQIISFLVESLNSKCIQLSLICKSIMYIFLIVHPQCAQSILSNLFSLFQAQSHVSKVFYQIFGQYFEICINQELIKNIIQAFLNKIMDIRGEDNNAPNQQLSQILLIINKNIKKLNKQICQNYLLIMIQNFLFNYSGNIKAIHPSTRRIIYQSVQNCLNLHEELEILPIIKKIFQQIQIGSSTQQQVKQNKMGVGLANLGNICYMNSQLQLLHSIKPFVKQINKIKTESPLLMGLQKLFLNLTHSFKKYISPQEFILSFDPPIDVSLQEDTTQFLISFLDKLEAGQKNNKLSKVIKYLFKGQTISNMDCSQCNKGKQNIEDFLIYSLNIKNENKNFSNLEQCIENAKNPEIIYDVNCENCKKKTKFNKTTILKSIPTYFFINLKRLIFDYENPYTKVKIHSQLQFPQKLQINKQKLTLKAVITHSGTGQYGHYYTSVKQNQGWVIYNDAKVYHMPQNGKEDNWYGGMQSNGDITYSTNAYVLLYQKDKKQDQEENKTNYFSEQIQQINKNNKILLTRYLLFGEKYIKDFVNFAYNVLKLPKNPNKYISIYQLLGTVSYPHGVVTQTTPTKYFQNFIDNTPPQSIISLIYEYKQHNNQLLFHRNAQLRRFFSTFMTKVFGLCIGNSELTLVYACQIVNKYIPLLKQNQYFVNSGQYTKLVAFLLRSILKPQLMKQFFQSRIISQVLLLCKSRKLQITLSYRAGTQIMQPFLQLLLSFIYLVKNQQQPTIFQFMNQYQQNLVQIRQVIKNEQDFNQLIFLNNSHQQYLRLFIQSLQLNKENVYLEAIIQLCRKQICNWNAIDVKSCQNFSLMVIYIYQQYFSRDIKRKYSFCMNVLGMIFPYTKNQINSTDLRLFSLKDRTYQYRTSNLQPSLIQVISQVLINITCQLKNQIDSLQILDILLKLLLQILKNDPLFVNYFNNLCSPIGLYGDFCLFVSNQVNQLLRKIQQRIIIISDKDSKFDQKRRKLQQSVQGFRTILQQNDMQNQMQYDEPVICGKISKQPQQIIQSLTNGNIFVRVQQYSYNWIGFKNERKSLIIQYVGKQYKLLQQHSANSQLTKIMRPIQNEKIQQEQTVFLPQKFKSKRNNNQMRLDLQQNLQINSDSMRRKFIFSNLSDQQCIVKVQINCRNMKNRIIQLVFKLSPNQHKNIWVQRMKMKQQWGQMILYINGSQLKISVNQGMGMDEGYSQSEAIMVQNVSLNSNDAMM